MSDRAIPNLPSRDFDATESFYGACGFERSFRDADWMILRRRDLQLEFFSPPGLDPAGSSFMCSVRVADLDELYAAIERAGVTVASRGIPRLVPPVQQPWGLRAGYLIDLDGTQLALIEDAG